MEEKKRPPQENEPEQENESNAARRIRAMGEDTPEPEEEPLHINKWENFWYHHKTKVIMIAAFTLIIGVAVVQFASRADPDINLLYAGPKYITPNMNRAFCDAVEDIMPDYDGNGKIYAQLNDIIFMTPEQMETFEAEAEAAGEDAVVDRLGNKQMEERFTYEVFGSSAPICILSEGQYEMVKGEGGFLPLAEVLDEIPEGAVDAYGVRLADTKFYKFYTAAQIFPEDAMLALRRVSTMSALTGRSKAERLHERSRDLFCRILTFTYPEGYVPPEAADTTAAAGAAEK